MERQSVDNTFSGLDQGGGDSGGRVEERVVDSRVSTRKARGLSLSKEGVVREVLSGLSARSRLIVLLTIELSLLGRQLQRALAGAGRTTIIGVGLTAGLIGVTIAWRCGWSRAVRRFLRTRVRELAIFAGAALCGGALMVLTLQPELIELSHVAVFGGLGASLLLDRLVREEVLAKAATQALLLAVTAGIFDELLQLAHPERVADVRDVALNACGGAIGVLAVALSIQGSRRKQSD